MWEFVRLSSLMLATLASGLQAGLYYAFSCAVMPGLGRGDNRTFIAAMQQINTAIINPWFMLSFLGAPLLGALAVALHAGRGSPARIWVIVGFVLALTTFMSTAVINVPLNNALAAAGAPDQIPNLTAVRTAFETSWVRWNTFRAFTSTGSLLALAWALAVVHRW